MAAKTSRHGYEPKLRHCHPCVYGLKIKEDNLERSMHLDEFGVVHRYGVGFQLLAVDPSARCNDHISSLLAHVLGPVHFLDASSNLDVRPFLVVADDEDVDLAGRDADFHLQHRCDGVLFCSLAVLDPRVGHTMDVLSPCIPVLCHSG